MMSIARGNVKAMLQNLAPADSRQSSEPLRRSVLVVERYSEDGHGMDK
jgi:hypothetical protein